MRYLVALAALVLLGLAAWVSWGGSGGRHSLHPALDSHAVPAVWGLAISPCHPVVAAPNEVARMEGGKRGAEGIQAASAPILREATPSIVLDEGTPGGQVDAEVTRVLRCSSGACQADAPAGVPRRFTGYLTIFCCKGDSTGAYCGNTASGIQVAEVDPETGFRMAACSLDWPFGSTFLVAGRWPVVCQDRGSAVVTRTHLDVYFYDCGLLPNPDEGTGWAWLQKVGTQVEVEVLP